MCAKNFKLFLLNNLNVIFENFTKNLFVNLYFFLIYRKLKLEIFHNILILYKICYLVVFFFFNSSLYSRNNQSYMFNCILMLPRFTCGDVIYYLNSKSDCSQAATWGYICLKIPFLLFSIMRLRITKILASEKVRIKEELLYMIYK